MHKSLTHVAIRRIQTYLKRYAFEALGGDGGLFNRTPTGDAACEGNKVYQRVLDGVCCQRWRKVDYLNDILGYACTSQCECEAFGGERCLRRWLEKYGIACNDGGKHGVDGDKVREAGRAVRSRGGRWCREKALTSRVQ